MTSHKAEGGAGAVIFDHDIYIVMSANFLRDIRPVLSHADARKHRVIPSGRYDADSAPAGVRNSSATITRGGKPR